MKNPFRIITEREAAAADLGTTPTTPLPRDQMTQPTDAPSPQTSPKPIWECFSDSSYWDMWAVRPVHERRWGHCFHLPSQQEAESLRDLLESHGVKSLAPKKPQPTRST